ncbi:MAG TPA: ABC transporter permease/substrate-binding protein [Kofleriaceae bacterium]|jgi:osmoprotectant transport system permease protein
MTELLRGIPPLLAAHLELALVALILGAAISLPVAILVSRRPHLAEIAIAATSIVQTVPGLALLALMVPILSSIGAPPFGFWPALVALALYALLPILRNTVTGLRGVDAAAVEAATGMGMSPWQVMRLVQLPLAAPVIAAGVRTAAVWTVGAATLATPVGQACLGNYIFTGLQTRNFAMLLAGVMASAALALTLDAILAAFEAALASRHRGRAWIPVAALVVFVAVVVGVLPRAITAGDPIAVQASAAPVERDAVTHVRIGAKTFTEQYVLAELIRARLAASGITAELAQSLGSNVIFDALVRGNVDVYVDYTGTLWTNVMHRATNPPRWQVLAEIEGWLAHEHGVRSLGSLGFENTYAIAVRRQAAEQYGLSSLADLAHASQHMSLGADYEFLGRAEWAAVQRVYGVQFARSTTFDPALLYDAASRGEVDAISAFSSDGRIAANDLVVLADPRGALPPYDATILLGARVANDARVVCALAPLHVSVELMRQANAMVDRDKVSASDAAAWLLARIDAPRCP